jgi:hypothetical protein
MLATGAFLLEPTSDHFLFWMHPSDGYGDELLFLECIWASIEFYVDLLALGAVHDLFKLFALTRTFRAFPFGDSVRYWEGGMRLAWMVLSQNVLRAFTIWRGIGHLI